MTGLWWLFLSSALAGEGQFVPYQTTLMDRGVSLLGVAMLIGVAWLISERRGAVNWRPVFWGVGLQLLFGAIVLSPTVSGFFYSVVDGGVRQMLAWSAEGSHFLFGSISPHQILDPEGVPQFYAGKVSPPAMTFATWILPTIVFFSAVMSVFYYLGIMQFLVKGIAWVMVRTMGTSGAESLSAAGNIFVGQTEAPLLVRPFVETMTRSELTAVMVGGFATVSGGVMGAYVNFLQGIPNIAGHLVVASIISAPAALAVAKVLVPETEESKSKGTVKVEFEQNAGNVMEAAANGATDGVKLALNVGGMLLAFVALVAMFNWFVSLTPLAFCDGGGVQVGYACQVPVSALPTGAQAAEAALAAGEVVRTSAGATVQAVDGAAGLVTLASEPLSLSRVFGWLFAPIALMMGVPWADALQVGRLLGEKIMLTEFIAYMNLGNLIHGDTPVITERSAIIASYALSGFANFASIGVQLGGIGGIAPNRMRELASLGMRAMFGGVIAACMTGAVAGLFL